MLGRLSSAVDEALAEGYAGLWASGDMTWEFGGEANLDKLLEYERRLEELMVAQPALSGICLYHRDTLPAHAIATAFSTHRTVYVNSALSEINPRYYQQAARKA